MEIRKDVLWWLKTVAEKNNLKEKLSYGDISLWWFYEFNLCLRVTNLLNAGTCESNSDIFREYVAKLPKYYLLYSLVKTAGRYILGKLIGNKTKENGGRGTVLAVSYTGNWRNCSVQSREDKGPDQDIMLGDITTLLRNNNYKVVALDEDSSLLLDYRTTINKRRFGRPVETYLTFDIMRSVLKAGGKCKKEWDNLKNNQEFIDSLNYEGIPLSRWLKHELGEIFEQRAFQAILFIELMRQAIKVEMPDLILITCEYGSLGRGAVVAGKLEGVPTLAIQHGNIFPHHTAYIHAKDEISGGIAPEYHPLPDRTAVYGPWTKKVLVECGYYPEDSVAVTGQARYDVLARAGEVFSREEFCKRYGLDPGKKIALACIDEPPALEGVLRAVKGLPQVQLMIKPHPNEKGKWYKKLAKEQETKVLILAKRSDTYEAIYACDVILSFFSTTMTEALILNKLVVVVNLTRELDPMPYVESGAALGAYREADIEPAIRKALYDRDTREGLRKARARFVHEHCYEIDGKATARVTELIKEMIATSRHLPP